jgi:hypothetical protein
VREEALVDRVNCVLEWLSAPVPPFLADDPVGRDRWRQRHLQPLRDLRIGCLQLTPVSANPIPPCDVVPGHGSEEQEGISKAALADPVSDHNKKESYDPKWHEDGNPEGRSPYRGSLRLAVPSR